jgi:hypothetical protein
MDTRTAGIVIALVGVGVVVVGLLVAAGAPSWFGRLPGDIRWESGSTRVYVPLTTMVLVSVALSVLAYVVRRLF